MQPSPSFFAAIAVVIAVLSSLSPTLFQIRHMTPSFLFTTPRRRCCLYGSQYLSFLLPFTSLGPNLNSQ
ncbi:hypothetical protein KFK09_022577 [Dendrobium nobile]|uniref:Uncharacterized protein n=1 Tax=Dendrobium nobile TaxID=94219 RepID=A0A8T3AJ51_DENNO|nr:hypothetical protein KFK09_022577 [Dendrobium nobile]